MSRHKDFISLRINVGDVVIFGDQHSHLRKGRVGGIKGNKVKIISSTMPRPVIRSIKSVAKLNCKKEPRGV